MKNIYKQIKDKKRYCKPKRQTIFCIEAHSPTEPKEPSDIQRYRNVTESVFYFAFYNNKVASGCHNFLEYLIQCCKTELQSFFDDMIVNKGT